MGEIRRRLFAGMAGNIRQLKTRRLAGSGIEAGVIEPCPREHHGL
jgi:hypothetical protein